MTQDAMIAPCPLHIVFDGPPGLESGRFVECETPDGTVGTGYVNPDGPEAADRIEKLEAENARLWQTLEPYLKSDEAIRVARATLSDSSAK